MSELQFTTVDRVLAKFNRDLRGTDINESDAIEWIGEALDAMKLPQVQEHAVAFIEVKDHHADLPHGFHMISQINKYRNWSPDVKSTLCIPTIMKEVEEDDACKTSCDTHPANKAGYPIPLDCDGRMIGDYEVAYYRPFFDLQWEYKFWSDSSFCQNNFTPVRLSNNLYFNSLVCKEKDRHDIYKNCGDEYTIVGTTEKRLRFSFREGFVAVSYLRNSLDPNTGYPLVPDNYSYMNAITYYLKWKIAEWYDWNGREGFARKAQDNERKWLKYKKQGTNYMKMPKSLDQYQNLLDQSHHMIPRRNLYYGYFGNLNKAENKRFNNPDNR